MPFISNTDAEREKMLRAIGVERFEDLLAAIPTELRMQGEFALEPPYAEMDITRRVGVLADRNLASCRANSYLGAGVYEHFVPSAVDHIVIRPEFLTAYTPYQAEVSQGTLQAIYEYQSLICELTGMEIANAGMYDGATAVAEAILMAARESKKMKAVIAGTINPTYLDVIRTYTGGIEMNLVVVPPKNGTMDPADVAAAIDAETACLVVQTPNFYGCLEDMAALEPLIHAQKKALFVAVVDPVSLPMLNAPAEYKADVVVGEGQALGNKMNFGGPLFGFFASRIPLARQMPGRIVGATVDTDGKRAFALTLQPREQHIRRAKATSNICSNQALASLASAVHMTLMGPQGMRDVAGHCLSKAHYLAERILALPGFAMAFDKPFFKEFVVNTPIPPAEIIGKLRRKRIFPGLDLAPWGVENALLVAVTETKTRAQLDQFVENLAEVTRG
jgi:glycine dehydrogenase subunit 1